MDTVMVFHPHKIRLFQRSDQPSNFWFMRVSIEGKQYRRSLKTCHLETAKQAATNFMIDILAKQKAGQRVFSTSLKQFRDAFHLDMQRRVARGERSKLTVRNITIRIDKGLEFLKSEGFLGSAAMDSVDGKVWQGYIDWRLKKTPGMRRDGIDTELTSIRSAFEWARKQGWCAERNIPVWELQIEKSRAIRDKLTHQQFYRVVKLMRQWAGQATPKQKLTREMVLTVFMTILNSGLRTGECLKLTRKDVLLGKDEIILTVRAATSKVRKSRQVPLLHSGGLWLRNWLRLRPDLQPDDLVFAVHKTKNASLLFYREFSRFRDAVLIPEGLGDAEAYHGRHQYVTERLQAGESIHLVAKLCGTSVKQIESTYSGVIDLVIGREFARKKLTYNEADGTFEVVKREGA